MMNGAHLRGAMQASPARPAGGRAMTAADLLGGPPVQPGPQEGPDELEEAIGAILQAAESQGFTMPPEGVSQEQLPAVYQQLLQAAARSDLGATDGGIRMIVGLSQALGVPSPWHRDSMGPPAEHPNAVLSPSGRPYPLPRVPDYALGPEGPGAIRTDNYQYPYRQSR